MPARRVSDTTIVIVAGVLIVTLGIAAALLDPAPNPLDAGTSSFSAGPRGMKAAYLTLRELGYDVERSIEPMTTLRAEPSATTLILSGQEPPSEQDKRAFRAFVDQGGTLVAIGGNGGSAVGLVVPSDAKPPLLFDDSIKTFQPLVPSPLVRGAGEITMRAVGERVILPGTYVPLYGASLDNPVVAVASIGKGRVVWLADTTPLANGQLDEAGNLRFVLNVVGAPSERRVVFDEHYQGHKRSLASYTAGTPLPWIALQAGFIGIAVLLTHSRRPGPVRAPHADPRTSPMEFVEMLGTLYKRAGARQAAVNTARMRLRRAIALRCGVPVTTDDETLARVAGSKLRTDPAPIARLLADADTAAAAPQLDTARALEIMRQLQALSTTLA